MGVNALALNSELWLVAALAAQFGGSDPKVPTLPDPPVLEYYFLETPWLPMAVAVTVGLIGFGLLRKSGKTALGWTVAAGGVGLAVVLALIAHANTTTRELLSEQGAALIEAVAKGDVEAVDRAVSANVSMVVMGEPYRKNKEQVLDFVSHDMMGRYKLREYSSTLRSAVIDGINVARTQHKVRVVPEFTGLPSGSIWVLHWRQSSSGQWQVVQIEAQYIDGVGARRRF